MFLAELFTTRPAVRGRLPKVNGQGENPVLDEIPRLSRIPPKFLPLLKRLAKFHGIQNLEFDSKNHKWVAKKGTNMEPFINDATYMTSVAGSGTELLTPESIQFNESLSAGDIVRINARTTGFVLCSLNETIIFRTSDGYIGKTKTKNCAKLPS